MKPKPADKHKQFRVRIVASFMALIVIAGVIGAHLQDSFSAYSGYDFRVYYTAAWMARSGLSAHMYDSETASADLQLDDADASSVFAKTAIAHGIPSVMMYVYPPTLADMLVPLTVFTASKALWLWRLLCILMLVVSGVTLLRILNLKAWPYGVAASLFFIFYRPALECLSQGQAPILLQFLVIIGLSLYLRKRTNIAALMIAIAIAVKLTPLIVVIPFIAWRDWKILRGIAVWSIVIIAALFVVNGAHALHFYLVNVVPGLHGPNQLNDRSLGAMLYEYSHGFDEGASSMLMVRSVSVVSSMALLYAGWLSSRTKACMCSDIEKAEIVCVFMLLSCCLSPIAWVHAYVLVAPLLVISLKRISDGGDYEIGDAVLLLFMLAVSNSRFKYFSALAPVFGIAFGMMRLYRLRIEQQFRVPDRGSVNPSPLGDGSG